MLEYNREAQKVSRAGQFSLFGGGDQIHLSSLRLKEAEPATKKERLVWEKDLLGLYVTEHPLEEYSAKFQAEKIMPLKDLSTNLNGKMVSIGGLVSVIRRINTKAGDPMLFVKMEDLTASSEILVFPKVLARNPDIWQTEKVLKVTGRVSDKDGTAKILCESAVEMV